MSELAIVVLAAGQSSRLGQPKQLVSIDNEALIKRQCKLALSISPDVYCVLGYQAELIQSFIKDLPLNVLINSHWQQGMSSSISCAINELPDNIQHVMVVLVDQWQLDTKVLSELAQCSFNNPDNIYASECSQSLTATKKMIGPPSIFPKLYFSELINMDEITGAKSLILKHIENVTLIDCPEAFIDLDVMADLEQLRQIYPC